MPRATPIAVTTALAGVAILAWAGASQASAEDRYGPPTSQDQLAPPLGATLSWPGKIQFQPPAPQTVARRAAVLETAEARPARAAGAALPTSIYDTAPPQRSQVAARSDLQPTAYDAPARYQSQPYAQAQQRYAPTPAQSAAARAQDTQFPAAQSWPQAHYYSVDRQFGLKPDPIPLPKQFFGSDVDMAAPPAPPPLTSAQANTPAGRALIDQQQDPTGTAN